MRQFPALLAHSVFHKATAMASRFPALISVEVAVARRPLAERHNRAADARRGGGGDGPWVRSHRRIVKAQTIGDGCVGRRAVHERGNRRDNDRQGVDKTQCNE